MPSNSKKMTFNLVVAAFLLSLGIEQVFGRQALAKRFAALRQADVARQADGNMQFKKGVRGECFETYLSLEDDAKEEAKKVMYEMEGWHELAKIDGNWRIILDAVAQFEANNEKNPKVIEKSTSLEKENPIQVEVTEIKTYQREMTKQMLKVVKLAEKEKYVQAFTSLDFIGKKELPCVKAIQESYASKYPNLLQEKQSNDLKTETDSELETAKNTMKSMIDEYGKKVDKLLNDATTNSETSSFVKAIQGAAANGKST